MRFRTFSVCLSQASSCFDIFGWLCGISPATENSTKLHQPQQEFIQCENLGIRFRTFSAFSSQVSSCFTFFGWLAEFEPECPPQSRQNLRAPYVHHKAGKICAHLMCTTKQSKSARTLCPPQSRQNLRAPYLHHKAGKIFAHLMSTTKQAKSASTTEQAKSARAPSSIHKAGKLCGHLLSTTKQAKSARAFCPPQSRQNLRATNVHHKSRQNVRATNVHHKAGKICARLMSTTKQAKSARNECPPQKQAKSARNECPPQRRQNLRAPYVHHKAGKFCARRISATKQAKSARALCSCKICAHLMSTTGFIVF